MTKENESDFEDLIPAEPIDALTKPLARFLRVQTAGGLAGIGFTMSLYVTELALEGNLLNVAKVGVLIGSVVSAAIGMTLIAMTPNTESASDGESGEAAN